MGRDDDTALPILNLQAEINRMKKASLSSAVKDVDKMIDLLVAAREQVAGGR
jgi:hypothetical protein